MTSSDQPFSLVYDQEIRRHLAAIASRHHALIRQTITDQLSFEADIRTRNRKPLSGSAEFSEKTWEIRFGPGNCFRVFYRLNKAERMVYILAIGEKRRNQLWIGGERFEL